MSESQYRTGQLKAKPILFNSEMVKAIQEGRKTMTRRISRIFNVDDILYVRETWFYEKHMQDLETDPPDFPSGRFSRRYVYRADQPNYPVDIGIGATGWKPSLFMPLEAARIFLRVTDVFKENIQDITMQDIVDEGIVLPDLSKSFSFSKNDILKDNFIHLWDKLNGKKKNGIYAWNQNPLVRVYRFEVI